MNCCIIDDNPLFRDALAALLHQLHRHLKVHCIDRVGHLSGLAHEHRIPDVVLLDLSLPDTLGCSGVHEIRAAFPGCRIVVMDESRSQDIAQQCVAAGAESYLSKLLEVDALKVELRRLLAPDEQEAVEPLELTLRQRQLLMGIERGLNNRDIGAELGIAEHTVKVHLNRLFRKLGVKSRTQALREVRLRGVHLPLQGLSELD